jgi:hypothetical protein
MTTMKTYRVEVTCTARLSHTFEIVAEDEDDAREQAESEAWSLDTDDWDIEVESDPEIEKVEELVDPEEDEEKDDEADENKDEDEEA